MNAETLVAHGRSLLAAARYEEAADAFRRAAALDPNRPGVHGALGDCLLYQSRPAEAVACYRRELSAGDDARAAPFIANLARALADTGWTGEAVAAYRRAIALHPHDAALHSGLLLLLHYDPSVSDAQLRAEHEAWATRHAAPLARDIRPHPNDRTPGRRLRVGYVSPDLWGHVVGTSILPILEHHDRERFEVFCYSDTPIRDEVNARIEQRADVWRGPWLPDMGGEPRYFWRSDATLAEQIRLDRIDILVDLAGHMPRNRMLTFARKPAPVQVTYLGYAASTGLLQMDYRITDVHMDPPDKPSDGPEALLRLPHCYWAYRPAAPGVEVGPPPVARNGFVTFGSFNSFIKVNDAVIAVWARVMNQVPNSHLLAVMRGGEGNAHVRQQFESHGVAPDRLRLLPMQPHEDYFRLFNQVDVSLDPFPYNGGVSSLNSLWMGVPFVTLAGARAVGRAGLSILANVGLPDLIASDVEQYMALAVQLASDPGRLAALRGSLSDRLRRSPLMGECQFTRDVETRYVEAWEAWRANP